MKSLGSCPKEEEGKAVNNTTGVEAAVAATRKLTAVEADSCLAAVVVEAVG